MSDGVMCQSCDRIDSHVIILKTIESESDPEREREREQKRNSTIQMPQKHETHHETCRLPVYVSEGFQRSDSVLQRV